MNLETLRNHEHQETQAGLDKVKLSDYELLVGFEEWLDNSQSVPQYFLERVKSVSPDITISQLLQEIRKQLWDLYAGERVSAKSFEESRFTPVDQIIEKRLTSCGALANVFGTTLRELGVPTQFVHGTLKRHDPASDNRHAWLKIYNPQTDEWVERDPTNSTFSMENDAVERKVYHNWDELKVDYELGNY